MVVSFCVNVVATATGISPPAGLVLRKAAPAWVRGTQDAAAAAR
ncbi:hypothetical protein [Streptomyces nigra]